MGSELVKGVLTFRKKAADDEENDYFFIVDEINRGGNLSKIFELFMPMSDKRGSGTPTLPRELFSTCPATSTLSA